MGDTAILVISLTAIIVCILLNFFLKVNLGMLSMAVAFIVGCVLQGTSASTIYGYWPDNLIFFMIAGNLFFGYARANETILVFGKKILWIFRKMPSMIFWVFTFLSLLLGVLGSGPAVLVLLAPLGFVIAEQLGMNPFVLAYAVAEGYNIGTMNPWTGSGVILYGILEEAGVQDFTNVYLRTYFTFALQILLFCALVWAYFTFIRKEKDCKLQKGMSMESIIDPPQPFTPVQRKTMIIIVLSFSVLFIPNIINTLFTIDSVLWKNFLKLCKPQAVLIIFALAASVMKLADTKQVLAKIPMNSILTIAGICFLIEIAKNAGLLEVVSSAFSGGSFPTFLVPAMFCLVAGVLSFFASGTTVVLPLMFPLVPAISVATGIGVVTLFAAAQIGALITPISPFSTCGAQLVGVAPDKIRDRLIKQEIIAAIVTLAMGFLLCLTGFCSIFA